MKAAADGESQALYQPHYVGHNRLLYYKLGHGDKKLNKL